MFFKCVSVYYLCGSFLCVAMLCVCVLLSFVYSFCALDDDLILLYIICGSLSFVNGQLSLLVEWICIGDNSLIVGTGCFLLYWCVKRC